MLRRSKQKSAILTDLFSPTVEFLSQPRAFPSVGPWLPGDQPTLPAANRKLGNLYHLKWEDGSKEYCALNLTENELYFSPFNKKGTECCWKKWQTIRLTPFCVCGELDIGDSLLHDAVSEKALKNLTKKQASLPFSVDFLSSYDRNSYEPATYRGCYLDLVVHTAIQIRAPNWV
jgi:hypothetical protein